MMGWRAVVRACSLAVALSLWGWTAGCSAPAATHTVVMANVSFTPATLTVRPGDTIVWVNKDFFPHTATSTDAGRTFDSKEIGAGASWSYRVESAGEFRYLCSYHPTMTGTIVAQ
jgi:plastocyanin